MPSPNFVCCCPVYGDDDDDRVEKPVNVSDMPILTERSSTISDDGGEVSDSDNSCTVPAVVQGKEGLLEAELARARQEIAELKQQLAGLKTE